MTLDPQQIQAAIELAKEVNDGGCTWFTSQNNEAVNVETAKELASALLYVYGRLHEAEKAGGIAIDAAKDLLALGESTEAELTETRNEKWHLHQIYTTECNLRLAAEAERDEARRQLRDRAESVEKAPAPVNQRMLDALRDISQTAGDRRYSESAVRAKIATIAMGGTKAAESVPAPPDVVSGLVDALTDCLEVIEPIRDEFNKQGQKDVALACDEVIEFANVKLAAYEAQSKAEPKV